jgi:hypothetical protein
MPRKPATAKPLESQRPDGRGHWPAGKHRSTLSAAERAAVITRLRKAVEVYESIRGVARVLEVSDRSIRRALSGEDQPSERLRALVRARL